MKLPWKKILDAGKLLIDAVRTPGWPPKFCHQCDRRMKQLNGDPDVYVCADEMTGGGCGLWLRRPGTGKQQPELPNQGVHRGDL